MADRLDSERLRGFDFRQLTDGQTDICDSMMEADANSNDC